jgi:hypothetical protein
MRIFLIVLVLVFSADPSRAAHFIYHCKFQLLSPAGQQISAGKITLDFDPKTSGLSVSGGGHDKLPLMQLSYPFENKFVFLLAGEKVYLCAFYPTSHEGGCLTHRNYPATEFPAFYDCE